MDQVLVIQDLEEVNIVIGKMENQGESEGQRVI